MAIAEREPQRVVTVDAREPIGKVNKRIVEVVTERLLESR